MVHQPVSGAKWLSLAPVSPGFNLKGSAFGPVLDERIERHPHRWLCKEAKFKAREARGVRRTLCTPQRQRAEAQRRNWPLYEAISI
jgi:hypothetical protein